MTARAMAQLAYGLADAAGVPRRILGAIIIGESNWSPGARNRIVFGAVASEDSVGLLQLNRAGGQGSGYRVAELIDPRRNLAIGIPPIAAAWRIHGNDMAAVAIASGHPGPVPRNDDRIRAFVWIYERLTGDPAHDAKIPRPSVAQLNRGAPAPAAGSAPARRDREFPAPLLLLLAGAVLLALS